MYARVQWPTQNSTKHNLTMPIVNTSPRFVQGSCSSRQVVFLYTGGLAKSCVKPIAFAMERALPAGDVPPTDPTAETSSAEFTDVGTAFLIAKGRHRSIIMGGA